VVGRGWHLSKRHLVLSALLVKFQDEKGGMKVEWAGTYLTFP
jgi:hypothetical protein